MSEIIRWKTIKEPREKYLVEYDPANKPSHFAFLSLTFWEEAEKDVIVSAMETEASVWLSRYAVPIMVSSYDKCGDLIDLKPAKECNHLMTFVAPSSGDLVSSWKLVKDGELPSEQTTAEYFHKVYSGLPCITREEVQQKQDQERVGLRIGLALLFLWLVIIPATLAFLGWRNPTVSFLAFLYSFSKAAIQALKLLGKWPESAAEKAHAAEDLKMRHHHYHCERNPEGFQRLKIENFERESEDEIRKEADALKKARNS